MVTQIPTARLRVRALAALEKSTKLIEVAFDLLKQGNVTEAARLKNQARAQRNLSVRLFALASGAEMPTRDRSTYLHDSEIQPDKIQGRSVQR